MLTMFFHMWIKPGHETESAKVVAEAIAYRQNDEPRHLVLFEQWRDGDALNAHIARLQRVYGPPNEREPYPPTHHRRRLPKAFLALFEKTEAARYEPIV